MKSSILLFTRMFVTYWYGSLANSICWLLTYIMLSLTSYLRAGTMLQAYDNYDLTHEYATTMVSNV